MKMISLPKPQFFSRTRRNYYSISVVFSIQQYCKNSANEKAGLQIEWHGRVPMFALQVAARPKPHAPESFSHAALLFSHTCLRSSQHKYEVKEREGERKSHCVYAAQIFDLALLPQVRCSGSRMVKSGGRQLPPAVHSI
jgi:hypothetical protein